MILSELLFKGEREKKDLGVKNLQRTPRNSLVLVSLDKRCHRNAEQIQELIDSLIIDSLMIDSLIIEW